MVGKATLVVMAVAVVLVAVFSSLKARDEYKQLDAKVALQQRYASIIYKIALKDISSQLEAKANLIIGDDKIKEAFAARDRTKLHELSKPFYDALNSNFKMMAFIGDDNKHFLRMQEPNKFGDNMSKKRPIITEMNTYHKPLYTFEPTLYGLNFVYLAPVFHKGKYVGFFNIGVDAATLQSKLDEYLNAKTAILFDTASMSKFGDISDKHKIGDFSLVTYNDAFFSNIPKNYDFIERSLKFDDKTMNIAEYNITDHNQRTVAKMLFALNIEPDIKRAKTSIFKSIFLSLPMLIGIFVILKYTFSVLMDRIEKNEEDLKERLYFDTITGLPNRVSLKEDLEKLENPFIILVDIDSFKEINDLYGYEVGDYVLAEQARRIKERLPKKLGLYRLSADEFAIIGDEADKYKNADNVEALISSFAKEPLYCEGNKMLISLTAGASFDGKQEHADMALKQAKKTHVPYIVYCESLEIAKEYEKNIKWTAKLREAITDDRITLFYQPIVDAKSGKIERYEALVRLIEVDGTPISPYYFLEISKKAKLYHSITKTVISKAIKKFENSKYAVSINISAEDILSPSIREFIIQNLIDSDGKTKIIFEIVESDGIENYEEVSKFVTSVKKYGAQIAIDDFGAGYSNFEHLMRLNVDYIKIDGSLIKNLTTSKNSEIIVETIVSFAKKMGMKSIAEFVHSKEIMEKAALMGIDYCQGFYFSEAKEEPSDRPYLP